MNAAHREIKHKVASIFVYGKLIIEKTFATEIWWQAGQGWAEYDILQYMETPLSHTSVVVLNTGSGSCRG